MSYLGYLFWKAFAELSHGVLLIFRLYQSCVGHVASGINLDTEPVF